MIDRSYALVLDFGGVISRTMFETHALTEVALGLSPGSLTWQGPFAPESDPLWCSMQADAISERDYWMSRTREVAALIGADWTSMKDFVIAARGADTGKILRPEALTAMRAAKSAGLKLGILSNELDLFYGEQFKNGLPFWGDLDAVVDATYTNILKPDPRAYEDCISQLGLEAKDCVFVDDQQRNITGAERVGMRTVRFDVTNPGASFARALDMLGVQAAA